MKIEMTYRMSDTRDGLYAYALHASAALYDGDGNRHPASIFVFRRSTPTMNPNGRTDRMFDDEFFNVATPVDMYDIPEGEPDMANGMPYFRDFKLDLWFRNKEDMVRAKASVDGDVAELAKLWDNLNAGESGDQGGAQWSEETVKHG